MAILDQQTMRNSPQDRSWVPHALRIRTKHDERWTVFSDVLSESEVDASLNLCLSFELTKF